MFSVTSPFTVSLAHPSKHAVVTVIAAGAHPDKYFTVRDQKNVVVAIACPPEAVQFLGSRPPLAFRCRQSRSSRDREDRETHAAHEREGGFFLLKQSFNFSQQAGRRQQRMCFNTNISPPSGAK